MHLIILIDRTAVAPVKEIYFTTSEQSVPTILKKDYSFKTATFVVSLL